MNTTPAHPGLDPQSNKPIALCQRHIWRHSNPILSIHQIDEREITRPDSCMIGHLTNPMQSASRLISMAGDYKRLDSITLNQHYTVHLPVFRPTHTESRVSNCRCNIRFCFSFLFSPLITQTRHLHFRNIRKASPRRDTGRLPYRNDSLS